MNKISKAKKQQIVLVFIVTLGVIAGIWFFLVKSQSAKLASVRQKTQEMNDKVSKAENLLKKGDEIAAALEENVKELETIESGMASGDIYLWMINTINQFNHARKVTFLDFPREILGEVGIIPKFPYKAATFSFKGNAYYHDLGRFLADLENKFPYFRVQNLELSPGAKSAEGEAEKLNFKFEIVALIKPSSQ